MRRSPSLPRARSTCTPKRRDCDLRLRGADGAPQRGSGLGFSDRTNQRAGRHCRAGPLFGLSLFDRPLLWLRRGETELSRPGKECLRRRLKLLVVLRPLQPVQDLVPVVDARPAFMLAQQCDRVADRADRPAVPQPYLRLDEKLGGIQGGAHGSNSKYLRRRCRDQQPDRPVPFCGFSDGEV